MYSLPARGRKSQPLPMTPMSRNSQDIYSPALVGMRTDLFDLDGRPLGVSFVARLDSRQESGVLVRPVLPEGTLLLYHQIWRALLCGSPAAGQYYDRPRPPLPVELVRLVIRAAALMVPDRQQTHRAERSIFMRVMIDDEAPVMSRVWFWTKPLTLARIAAVQLVTVSHDQGWVSPPTDVCHSWYEWGVFSGPISDVAPRRQAPLGGRYAGAISGNEPVWRMNADGTVAANKGLWRRTHGNPVADREFKQHDGAQAGMDDEMWEGVPAGAIIAVRACAQQAMWENHARYGEILVWKWFEPVA
ncbi:hypothetical protein B0H15DRAFT_840858 [Mycena belliarum]|uniref:Uncharacterized protein n=1 Tax=Mycena belliarum TaxID=1033014 RepID=A0AAD6U502_9AGAR|nr:hypothetical protein B0H15DRAFT_840858 [Mycena belliae]